MRTSREQSVAVEYEIKPGRGGFAVQCMPGERELFAAHLGELVYVLEGDIVVQLQLARPDLLFLHAAVIANEQWSCLLTGPSGAGKSTTCWGMLHHGFRYSSDELAPVSVSDNAVLAYSHALCLKREPPAEYLLPGATLRSERGFHIPVDSMPNGYWHRPPPPRWLVFVQYDTGRTAPQITRVDAAEAAARLYPNVLNALAHPRDGLTPVVRLVSKLDCLHVRAARLDATCAALADCLTSA